MDDYPRGPPHAGELHLDLISWMGFFTRTMKEIAEFIGEVDDAVSFGEIERGILQNIDGEGRQPADVLTFDADALFYCRPALEQRKPNVL